MLRNNLHPDVAENPADLVVYGGIGKAARNWESYYTIERELKRLGDEQTLLVQSGKPVAVFDTHDRAPRVLIANSNLVAQLGQLGDVPRARLRRADDVRPDDRRLLDLHRVPGDPAGHLRDVRGGGAQALRRHPRRAAGRHRRPRRHGRRPAAGDHDARRRRAVHRDRHLTDREAHPDRLSGRARRRSRRRARPAGQGARREARPVDRAGRQRRRDPARARPPRHRGRRRHRPDLRARPAQRLRSGRA